MEKKKIAPVLMKLKIGESEVYPAIQKSSIESTRQRLQQQFSFIGMKFSVRLNDDRNIRVTRIA